AQADALHVGAMLRELPEGALWALAGLGDAQLPMNAVAIALGGGVRVGLEDSIYLDRSRSRLATNAGLLERVHRLAAEHERPLMSPAELRRRLGLESRVTTTEGT
ncbi:MAG: 3-keto-5-aminohexanoate cleavage protein, partial [Bacteroidetes bacterium]